MKAFSREDSVFLSRIQLLQNPKGKDRLSVVTENIIWDEKTQGCYIKKNSTAHSLCVLLGFEPYQNQPIPDGTYDRYGLVK